SFVFLCTFFFFQAEDGIRDFHVTGVQTCALPILVRVYGETAGESADGMRRSSLPADAFLVGLLVLATAVQPGSSLCIRCLNIGRSEERRVGKECRWRWGGDERKKNKAVRTDGGRW